MMNLPYVRTDDQTQSVGVNVTVTNVILDWAVDKTVYTRCFVTFEYTCTDR
jgi:hypothetical protein